MTTPAPARSLGAAFLAAALFSTTFASESAKPATTQPAAVGPAVLDMRAVKARLEAAQADKTLDEAAKAKVVALYEKALAQLRASAQAAARADALAALVKEAPTRVRELKEKLKQAAAKVEVKAPLEASLAELESELAKVDAALKQAQTRVAALESQLADRAGSHAKIPEQIAAARKRLAELAVRKKAIDGEAPALTRARDTWRRASEQAVRAEIREVEAQVGGYDTTGDLLRAQRDLAAREVARLGKLKDGWRQLVAERRLIEVKRQAKAARTEQQRLASIPELKSLAQENADWAAQREKLAPRIKQVRDELKRVNADKQARRKEFANVKKKVDVVGLTDAVGLILRKKRDALPSVLSHQQRMASLEADSSEKHE